VRDCTASVTQPAPKHILEEFHRLGRNASRCAHEWGIGKRTAASRVSEARRRYERFLSDIPDEDLAPHRLTGWEYFRKPSS